MMGVQSRTTYMALRRKTWALQAAEKLCFVSGQINVRSRVAIANRQ
jgi:hypothetical protein